MNTTTDFGQFLKHERELRGIPLEEIANATKIHIRFLVALESNNFEIFPGEVFIRGYIRAYASSIGTNVDMVLATYDECVGKQRLEGFKKNQFDKQEELLRQTVLRRNIVLGLIVIGIVFAGFFFFDKHNVVPVPVNKTVTDNVLIKEKDLPEKTDMSPGALSETSGDINPDQGDLPKETAPSQVLGEAGRTTEDGVSNSTPVTPPVQSSEKEKKMATPPTEKKKEVSAFPSPDLQSGISGTEKVATAEDKVDSKEPMRLRIRTKENSWFNIVVDGSRQVDFMLQAGTTKSFGGKESFKVTIGNKKGTELILNGRALVLPESEGDVIRDFQVTSKLLE